MVRRIASSGSDSAGSVVNMFPAALTRISGGPRPSTTAGTTDPTRPGSDRSQATAMPSIVSASSASLS
jgi:hypothetical protein